MKVKALLVLVLVIAFVSSCEVVTEPDLSIPQVVFEDEFDDYWPSLSPDGRYLAFLSDRDGEYPHDQYLLCVYDFEKNEFIILTEYHDTVYENFYYTRQVGWSNNSQWLYFARESRGDYGRRYQVCRIPLNGGQEDIEVLNDKAALLAVHPTEERLIFNYFDYPDEMYIAELDITTGILTPIESTRDIGCYAITYSRDGSAIIAHIVADDAPQYGADVVLFPIDGSTPQGLFNLGWDDSSYNRMDVSSSGNHVVFSSYFQDVTVYSIDGGEPIYPIPSGFDTPINAVWEDDGYLYFADGGIWRFKPEL